MDFGPISIGVSNQNLWLGPGQFSSLLMSNNAPGFNHFNIQTNRPLKTPIGSFQLNVIGGTLLYNTNQSFENRNLKSFGKTPTTVVTLRTLPKRFTDILETTARFIVKPAT